MISHVCLLFAVSISHAEVTSRVPVEPSAAMATHRIEIAGVVGDVGAARGTGTPGAARAAQPPATTEIIIQMQRSKSHERMLASSADSLPWLNVPVECLAVRIRTGEPVMIVDPGLGQGLAVALPFWLVLDVAIC